MLNSVSFQCTALRGLNKVGLVKPAEDGYRTVVLGALNVFNSAGEYYAYEQSKALFENSSIFMRKVNNGALRGENGHPTFEPGMNNNQFTSRLLTVQESRVCVHIRRVWLDYHNVRDKQGRNVIAIMGEVMPSGELGHVLEKAFTNPHENVAFSIRCFTEIVPSPQGHRIKHIRNIVTWDYVSEPGIAVADKYFTPTLEGVTETLSAHVSRDGLEKLAAGIASDDVGLESTRLNLDELMQSLGWRAGPQPAYLKW